MIKNNMFESLLYIICTSALKWFTLHIMKTTVICENYVKTIDFYTWFCYNIMYENFSYYRYSQTNK